MFTLVKIVVDNKSLKLGSKLKFVYGRFQKEISVVSSLMISKFVFLVHVFVVK